MLSFVAVILALVVSTTPTSAVAVHSSAQVSTPVSYVALGDSIAFGIGSSLPRNRGYPALIQELLAAHWDSEVELANLSVPGETAATFLADGQSNAFREYMAALEVAGRAVELVTVTLGGNEMLALQGRDAETRRAALEAFQGDIQTVASVVRDLAGDDAALVFTTYYDLSSGDEEEEGSDAWWIEQFNAAIRDAAGAHQATIAEVGLAFDNQIDQLTNYPHDVHPNNQGYLEIASVIWSALGLDRDAPEIAVISKPTSSRPTPTLRMRVSDDTGVASVIVSVDGRATQPHFVGDNMYVLLLDLRSADDIPLELTIEARDEAGNTTQLDHTVEFEPVLPVIP